MLSLVTNTLYTFTVISLLTGAKNDVQLELDGLKVTVPVGKPVPQSKYKKSCFYQSEYLLYNEHQARLRFLVKFSN